MRRFVCINWATRHLIRLALYLGIAILVISVFNNKLSPTSYFELDVIRNFPEVNKKSDGRPNDIRKPTLSHYSTVNEKVNKLNFNNIQINSNFIESNKEDLNKKSKLSQTRVIIVTSWRSGSTFLGELLRSYPKTFYLFEPLTKLFNNNRTRDNLRRSECLAILSDFSHCKFEPFRNIFKFISSKNTYMCQNAKMVLQKTVRLDAIALETLLQREELDIKVINLVRDPRGSINSRNRIDWCKSVSCSDPVELCWDLKNTIQRLPKFMSQFRKRYFFLRYEDLTSNTEEVARNLFTFLELPMENEVKSYIETHTQNVDRKQIRAHSTFRNSSAKAFAWRNSMSYENMLKVQTKCATEITGLGFRLFNSKVEYVNPNISVFLDRNN